MKYVVLMAIDYKDTSIMVFSSNYHNFFELESIFKTPLTRIEFQKRIETFENDAEEYYDKGSAWYISSVKNLMEWRVKNVKDDDQYIVNEYERF
jgi:hypothetical protein